MSATPSGMFGNADSGAPVLSSTGRFVVFRTRATNLSGGAPGHSTAGASRPRRRQRRHLRRAGHGRKGRNGQRRLADRCRAGQRAGHTGDSDTAEVSDDGRFVAFRFPRAANLVPGDSNLAWDVFLPRPLGAVRRAGSTSTIFGQQSECRSIDPQISISADGRYIAFASADGSLLSPTHPDDTNGALDVSSTTRVTGPLTRRRRHVARQRDRARQRTDRLANAERGRPLRLRCSRRRPTSAVRRRAEPSNVRRRSDDRGATRVGVAPDGTPPGRAQPPAGPLRRCVGRHVRVLGDQLRGARAAHREADPRRRASRISPATVVVPGSGAPATFTVTTQQHTAWWTD